LICCLFLGGYVFSQEARKIVDDSNVSCEEHLSRMDLVTIEAQNDPTTDVYVLVYEGKEKRYNQVTKKQELSLPAFGSAKANIRSIRKYLKTRGAPLERFKFVSAGFMENATLQVWVGPRPSVPPKPEPTLRKMKYRKGKPIGYCTSCCG
jgi:hypothetical protein